MLLRSARAAFALRERHYLTDPPTIAQALIASSHAKSIRRTRSVEARVVRSPRRCAASGSSGVAVARLGLDLLRHGACAHHAGGREAGSTPLGSSVAGAVVAAQAVRTDGGRAAIQIAHARFAQTCGLVAEHRAGRALMHRAAAFTTCVGAVAEETIIAGKRVWLVAAEAFVTLIIRARVFVVAIYRIAEERTGVWLYRSRIGSAIGSAVRSRIRHATFATVHAAHGSCLAAIVVQSSQAGSVQTDPHAALAHHARTLRIRSAEFTTQLGRLRRARVIYTGASKANFVGSTDRLVALPRQERGQAIVLADRDADRLCLKHRAVGTKRRDAEQVVTRVEPFDVRDPHAREVVTSAQSQNFVTPNVTISLPKLIANPDHFPAWNEIGLQVDGQLEPRLTARARERRSKDEQEEDKETTHQRRVSGQPHGCIAFYSTC